MDPQALLAGLDADQHRAVVSPARFLAVHAGAGSGKTRVLTRRIAHRVGAGDAEPTHILALTFTRRAARELTERTRRLGLRHEPTTGTFHAVAWAELRARWADLGRPAPALVTSKTAMLGAVAEAEGLRPHGRLSPAQLAAEIEWAKARLVEPDRYAHAAAVAGRSDGGTAEMIARCFAAYEARKASRGVVDFDDLLGHLATEIETDPSFAARQRWRFRHLFVDEAQDSNPLQQRLLAAWTGPEADLCVVGDPDQAIYAWNGADASLLTRFEADHPGAEVVRLTANHRSTPEILSVAAAALDGGTGRAARLVAHREGGRQPAVVAYPTATDEARGIARAARDHHRPGTRWDGQAVLVRTHGQMPLVQSALTAAQIPHRVRGADALLRRPAVSEAMATLATDDRPMALVPVVPASPERAGLASTDLAGLEDLEELAGEFVGNEPEGTAREFTAWLTATLGDSPGRSAADGVELVTLHAAKGLEWEVVHLAGLEAGLVPITHATTDEALAEERRLLHVAATRARDVLRLTWARQRSLGGADRDREPSPLLAPILEVGRASRAAAAAVDHRGALARARAELEADDPGSAQGGAGGPEGLRRPRQDPVLAGLWRWRDGVARRARVAPAVVLADEVLSAIARERPGTTEELARCAGLGPVKIAEYGDALLAVVADTGGVPAAVVT